MTAYEQSIFEEETLSTIEALQRQEEQYACQDYCRLHRASVASHTLLTDRKLMLKWSYNVVDYFNLNRETAAMAMSYSDRFLQTDHGPEFLRDTDKYQLLCIVSLYVAVKVHETASLTPKVFVTIGHGHYTEDQIENLERVLLNALHWRVNAPTALGFVRLFLGLIPETELDSGMKAIAYMLARAQTERAVGDYEMLEVETSKVGFASVQNSMAALGYCSRRNNLFISPAAFFSNEFVDKDLTELKLRLCDAISFETSMISMAPRASSKKTATKTKANTDSPQESTTPRSVLCHP
jgi:hypothetical protein